MRSLALLLLAAPLGCSTLTVETDHGPITGLAAPGVRVFLGVPYAAPPLGALRFAPPAPMTTWSEPRDATHFGPACVQPVEKFRPNVSEDCLTLNLFVPDGAKKSAVLVWIHGGVFFQGSSSDEQYDGTLLARRTGTIVVSINYRVGALGFLSHRALAKEQGRAVAPSAGLLDQRAALEWVQANIARFGGDPGRVAIFGCSAGAWSVCSQLASPKSRGLYSRAIMESGACSDALYFDGAAAEAQGDVLAAALGCTGERALECLRGKSAAEVAAALPMKRNFILSPGVWWGPVVDGVELPRVPLAAIERGEFARVPLLIGWNRDEGVLHTVGVKDASLEDVADFTRASFGAGAIARVEERYARDTPKESLTDVITEGVFACNARRTARAIAAQGVAVFLYQFTHPLDDEQVHQLGATHSVELWFVWGTEPMGIGLSSRERVLSGRVQDAWASFARSGDPSTGGLVFPRYEAETDEHLELDLEPRRGARLKAGACDFWDSIAAARAP